jgi:hypothetical protein
MLSKTIILMVIGQMKRTPAIPRGISKVSAASGPYAAELRASSPNTGIPLAGPILSAWSSSVARGRPNTMSASFTRYSQSWANVSHHLNRRDGCERHVAPENKLHTSHSASGHDTGWFDAALADGTWQHRLPPRRASARAMLTGGNRLCQRIVIGSPRVIALN